jgi:hypothetical protein
MTLNRELFFIPVLQNALQTEDVKVALKDAFGKINQLGTDKRYRQGFENFEAFIQETCVHHALIEKQQVEDLGDYPQDVNFGCELVILRGNVLLGTIKAGTSINESIHDIVPGTYTVKLSTGRVLWKGTLSKEDLIIRAIPGGQSIKLAADLGNSKIRPARIVTLLGGRIVLKIFKGFDRGVIQIELE